jgi:hypothetical protein
MLKSDQLEFERGTAAKTEGEDRYNGKENRHHDRDGTAGSSKSPASLSPVEILSKDTVRQQIGQLRGDLGQRSLLSGLATQFGQAIGHYGALRDAIDEVDPEMGLPDPTALDRTTEPHERGAILVAAVFDAFVSIYRSRVADLLRMTTGDSTRSPTRTFTRICGPG